MQKQGFICVCAQPRKGPLEALEDFASDKLMSWRAEKESPMPHGIPCELVTWDEFNRLSRNLASLIQESGFEPDMIVAIGRGGYMPARMLSDFLDLMDLASVRIVHYRGAQKEPRAQVCFPLNADPKDRRVLLVDDVSDTGDTFFLAIDHLMTRGKPADIRTAVLHP